MWRFFLHKIKQKIPTDKSEKIRSILSATYAFTAWNLAILTFYYSIQEEIPDTAEKKQKFAKKMKESNVDVEFIEIKGISINTSGDKEDKMNIVTT